MDYTLAALKLLCCQLAKAESTPSSSSSFSLAGIRFQRAWLQGVLVSGSSKDGSFLLDDGTGVIQLCLSTEFLNRNWNIGMYVMVVGGYTSDDAPMIKELAVYSFDVKKILVLSYASYMDNAGLQGFHPDYLVHKMVDLSPFPDREAMWHLEVIEAYKMFYENFE